jgi:hypothetical protein
MNAKVFDGLAVWSGIINADEPDMPVDEAKAILRWQFKQEDKDRIEELLDRNNEGELEDFEIDILDEYLKIGEVVGMLHAKARLSLKRQGVDIDG